MRLLIVTQKIDERDAVLGFMHGWVAEFARQTEQVSVICLEKGEVNLPENVGVFSLGKERLKIKDLRFKLGRQILYAWRFVRYIVQMRNRYDAVFVHMNPEYVVLGGLLWKLWGKTVSLWYAHKSTPWHLRVALLFIDVVFTSTASGFRLPSKKVKVVGQGIDVEKFKNQKSKIKNGEGEFRIVTVGRITPSKDYETLINAVAFVQKNSNLKVRVDIFGPTSGLADKGYRETLLKEIRQKNLNDTITFGGPVANIELPDLLGVYDLFVNMGQTGSLDKAVPEAMAVGLPVLTCNEAFKEVLGPFRADLMYTKKDAEALGRKVLKVASLSIEDRQALGIELRSIVVRNHSLQSFIKKIIFAIR